MWWLATPKLTLKLSNAQFIIWQRWAAITNLTSASRTILLTFGCEWNIRKYKVALMHRIEKCPSCVCLSILWIVATYIRPVLPNCPFVLVSLPVFLFVLLSVANLYQMWPNGVLVYIFYDYRWYYYLTITFCLLFYSVFFLLGGGFIFMFSLLVLLFITCSCTFCFILVFMVHNFYLIQCSSSFIKKLEGLPNWNPLHMCICIWCNCK